MNVQCENRQTQYLMGEASSASNRERIVPTSQTATLLRDDPTRPVSTEEHVLLEYNTRRANANAHAQFAGISGLQESWVNDGEVYPRTLMLPF
jgi:hypothetical protein